MVEFWRKIGHNERMINSQGADKPSMIPDTHQQGPGEYTDSTQLPLENGAPQGTDGQPVETLIPVPLPVRETARPTVGDGRDLIRRTSTDQDALPVIRLADSTAEDRQDASLADGQRETALDPVHDDLGPHTDRG
jgi:hypothetical protein